MDILQDIIKSLAKEEIKSYKLFTKRTHNFDTRKDVELFDSIKKNSEELDAFHNKQIYSTHKPDVKYYRLKNKITDDLGIVLTHLNHRKPEIDALHLLSLAKLFASKKQWNLSFHYLKLSERRSVEREDYALLESIYEQMVKLSINDTQISPMDVVEKRDKNNLKLNLLRELENNLAILSFELRTTQNLTEKKELLAWLDKTLKKTLKLEYLKDSPQLQIKVFQNLCRLMSLLKNYEALETYLKICLVQFEEEGLFKKETHEVKLQLLVYLCNTSYELKKQSQSLYYAEILHKAIDDYDKLYYNQYIFYYYNILVLNYDQTNLEKTISILQSAQEEPVIKNNPTHYFYILSNLTLFYFEIKKNKQAAKLFNQMYISDNYKSFDAAFKVKLQVFELVNRIEMGDVDVSERLLSAIQKELPDLDEQTVKQEVDFIEIIELYLKNDPHRWRPLKKEIMAYDKKYPQSSGLLSYASWLNTKI